MASLFESICFDFGQSHAMVDQALKSNNWPAVIDQYVRQVEENLEDLEDAAATIGGEAKSLKAQARRSGSAQDRLDRAIDAFLVEGSGRRLLRRRPAQQHAAPGRNLSPKRSSARRPVPELLDAKVRSWKPAWPPWKQQREELQALLDLAKEQRDDGQGPKSLDDLMGSGDSDIEGDCR